MARGRRTWGGGRIVALAWLAGGWALPGCGGPPVPGPAGSEAAVSGAAASAAAEPECAIDDDDCRLTRLGEVRLGSLRTDEPAEAVVARLGEPADRQVLGEEGASGLWLQIWRWPARGVEVTVAAPGQGGPLTVHALEVRAPFAEATDRGIALGATEAAVRAAYAGTLDPRGSAPGERLVAGSLYGGVLFRLAEGRVVSVFVGALAE